MAHRYKIIQTLFSSNFIYRVKYMIRLLLLLLWFIYIGLLIFYTELTHLAQKKKRKKKEIKWDMWHKIKLLKYSFSRHTNLKA